VSPSGERSSKVASVPVVRLYFLFYLETKRRRAVTKSTSYSGVGGLVSQTGGIVQEGLGPQPKCRSLTPDFHGPPSRNVGNVCRLTYDVRNLVNVGRWLNGHTLRTLRENMETKLHPSVILIGQQLRLLEPLSPPARGFGRALCVRLLLPARDSGTVFLSTSCLPRHSQHFVRN